MVIPQRTTRLQSGPGALCAVNHTPSAHVSVPDRSVAAWAGLYNLTQPSRLALGLASCLPYKGLQFRRGLLSSLIHITHVFHGSPHGGAGDAALSRHQRLCPA